MPQRYTPLCDHFWVGWMEWLASGKHNTTKEMGFWDVATRRLCFHLAHCLYQENIYWRKISKILQEHCILAHELTLQSQLLRPAYQQPGKQRLAFPDQCQAQQKGLHSPRIIMIGCNLFGGSLQNWPKGLAFSLSVSELTWCPVDIHQVPLQEDVLLPAASGGTWEWSN